MKRMRDIFIGILIGCMIMATPALADGVFTQINVVLDGTNVQLEGENIDVHSILYNGTTYLPIRKVAELVGKDIDWKEETKTANITTSVPEISNEKNNAFYKDEYSAALFDASGKGKSSTLDKDGFTIHQSYNEIGGTGGTDFSKPVYATNDKTGDIYYLMDWITINELKDKDFSFAFNIDYSNAFFCKDRNVLIKYVECYKIGNEWYISKDYYESAILPLIK